MDFQRSIVVSVGWWLWCDLGLEQSENRKFKMISDHSHNKTAAAEAAALSWEQCVSSIWKWVTNNPSSNCYCCCALLVSFFSLFLSVTVVQTSNANTHSSLKIFLELMYRLSFKLRYDTNKYSSSKMNSFWMSEWEWASERARMTEDERMSEEKRKKEWNNQALTLVWIKIQTQFTILS